MSTGIQWTDETWNPVSGCSKVSQGCKHCYAERDFRRPYPGRDFTDVRTHGDRLLQPLRWRKPRRVFVNSMSDLFHEDVPDSFIDAVFAVDEGARTKSGKWRAVPLSEGAAAALELLRPLTEASGYVLPQVHPDALTAAFRRHAERAGLPGHLHCLRHTFCANLVSAGVPLRTVQVLAGHASITTTERYAHLAPDHIANAVRFLRL